MRLIGANIKLFRISPVGKVIDHPPMEKAGNLRSLDAASNSELENFIQLEEAWDMTDDDKKKALGKLVKKARLKAGLTQGDVSSETGIPIGTYKNIERGQGMSFERAVVIAEHLGLSLDDLAVAAKDRISMDEVGGRKAKIPTAVVPMEKTDQQQQVDAAKNLAMQFLGTLGYKVFPANGPSEPMQHSAYLVPTENAADVDWDLGTMFSRLRDFVDENGPNARGVSKQIRNIQKLLRTYDEGDLYEVLEGLFDEDLVLDAFAEVERKFDASTKSELFNIAVMKAVYGVSLLELSDAALQKIEDRFKEMGGEYSKLAVGDGPLAILGGWASDGSEHRNERIKNFREPLVQLIHSRKAFEDLDDEGEFPLWDMSEKKTKDGLISDLLNFIGLGQDS